MYNATSVAGGDNPRSHRDEVFAYFKAPRATGLALAIVLHGLGTWECEKEGRGDNQGQRNSPDRARVAAHAAIRVGHAGRTAAGARGDDRYVQQVRADAQPCSAVAMRAYITAVR